MFEMQRYDKTFREEAVKLSDDIGLQKASANLGLSYHTLAAWRAERKKYMQMASVRNTYRNVESSLSYEKQLEKRERGTTAHSGYIAGEP
jgi:hypothetical protein